MGHCVKLIIAKPNALAPIQQRFPEAKVFPLTAELSAIPMFPELFNEIHESPIAEDLTADPIFEFFSPRVAELLQSASHIGGIAYVETDYFGGNGAQSAIAWIDGKAVSGPEKHKEAGPINRALAAIGVMRGRFRDEFEAVGLQHYRSMDRFAEN